MDDDGLPHASQNRAQRCGAVPRPRSDPGAVGVAPLPRAVESIEHDLVVRVA